MKARKLVIAALLAAIVGAGAIFVLKSGDSTAAAHNQCPQFTPLHGLMPLLFRVGLLPKPPIAATVAPGDTSTSGLIQPEIGDQIRCERAEVKTFRNVVYATPGLPTGKSISLKMDILIPAGARKRTVVVYVPGGGFVVAAKESALNLRTFVAEAGFAVASVEYRTSRDGATYREGIEDIKSAVRYVRAHAVDYGIDANAVVVWGESAGGYLAAMVGVTNEDGSFNVGANRNQSSEVQGVIDDFGASDISKLAADFDLEAQRAIYSNEGLLQYIGKTPGANTLDVRIASTVASPLTHIRADAPPFLIFHGNRDRMVSPSQTLILHDALTGAGARSTRYVVDGAGHGDLAFIGDKKSGLLWSTNKVMNLMLSFLDRVNDGA